MLRRGAAWITWDERCAGRDRRSWGVSCVSAARGLTLGGLTLSPVALSAAALSRAALSPAMLSPAALSPAIGIPARDGATVANATASIAKAV
jgi:hypothetical protein